MAFGEVSANYLEWFREQLPDRPDFDQLDRLGGTHRARRRRIEAENGCWIDAVREEVFDGLTARTLAAIMVRCILEAVAYALSDQMAALCDGSPPGEIRCAGGAARSDLWLQIKADVSGVATAATLCPEPTSLGAAMLAHAALGGADVQTMARQWVRLKPPHRPDPQRHRQYQRAAMQNNKLMPPEDNGRFPRSRAGNQHVVPVHDCAGGRRGRVSLRLRDPIDLRRDHLPEEGVLARRLSGRAR